MNATLGGEAGGEGRPVPANKDIVRVELYNGAFQIDPAYLRENMELVTHAVAGNHAKAGTPQPHPAFASGEREGRIAGTTSGDTPS